MSKPTLIIISGPDQVGKSTLAEKIREFLAAQGKTVQLIEFSSRIINLLVEITGDKSIHSDKEKHRPALIALGQAMNEYDPYYWSKALPIRQDVDVVVCCGARTAFQVAWLRAKYKSIHYTFFGEMYVDCLHPRPCQHVVDTLLFQLSALLGLNGPGSEHPVETTTKQTNEQR